MAGPDFDNRRRGPGSVPTKELNVAQLFNRCNALDTDLRRAKERIRALELAGNGYSFVRAASTVAQAIPNAAATTVVFEVENIDRIGEYDPVTGVFTAKYRGRYEAAWRVLSDGVLWAVGEFWYTYLSRNNIGTEGNAWMGSRWLAQAAITDQADSVGSAKVDLAAGGDLRVNLYHNQGGPVNTWNNGMWVYFHIARVG